MNNDIKEIERILATSGKYITYAERCYVLDYITNLQEENEYSNYCNEKLRKKITNLEYKIKLLEGDKDGND